MMKEKRIVLHDRKTQTVKDLNKVKWVGHPNFLVVDGKCHGDYIDQKNAIINQLKFKLERAKFMISILAAGKVEFMVENEQLYVVYEDGRKEACPNNSMTKLLRKKLEEEKANE